jgi:hypothetical protein
MVRFLARKNYTALIPGRNGDEEAAHGDHVVRVRLDGRDRAPARGFVRRGEEWVFSGFSFRFNFIII